MAILAQEATEAIPEGVPAATVGEDDNSVVAEAKVSSWDTETARTINGWMVKLLLAYVMGRALKTCLGSTRRSNVRKNSVIEKKIGFTLALI